MPALSASSTKPFILSESSVICSVLRWVCAGVKAATSFLPDNANRCLPFVIFPVGRKVLNKLKI